MTITDLYIHPRRADIAPAGSAVDAARQHLQAEGFGDMPLADGLRHMAVVRCINALAKHHANSPVDALKPLVGAAVDLVKAEAAANHDRRAEAAQQLAAAKKVDALLQDEAALARVRDGHDASASYEQRIAAIRTALWGDIF